MNTPPIAGIGLPWYRRGDYPRILQVMADGDSLPATFDEWEKQAKNVERQAAVRAPVYRAEIRPEKFVAWCAERGLDVDAKARIKFAADPGNWPADRKH